MSRVKAYRKLHPRATQVSAMKALAGKKPVKKSAPKKKSVTRTVKVASVGARKKTASPTSRAISISRKIEDLEVLLKHTSGTERKNAVKRMINAQYDLLDNIKLKSA